EGQNPTHQARFGLRERPPHHNLSRLFSFSRGYGGDSVGNMLRNTFTKAFSVVVICLGLAACAVVDQYSGRAVMYNLQAEQAQEQALLLNVVRASLRRPMQFTGLQSITGTANASGSLTGGGASTNQRPLVSLFGLTPPSSSTVVSDIVGATVGATASISGGPTFSVPV